MTSRKSGGSRRRSRRKKPYRTPRLVVHGNLGALTRKAGRRNDGGGRPKTRTGTG